MLRPRFASRGQLFIAGVIGVITGVYIYKPIYEQMRRNTPEILGGVEKQSGEDPKLS